MRDRDEDRRRIAAEARAFALRRTSGEPGEPGAADEQALQAWLAADPRHRAAWAELTSLWERLGPVAARLPRPARRARRRPLALALGLGLVAAAVALAVVAVQGTEDRRLRTDREARTYSLSDGSAVELDAGSEVEVSLRPWRRSARLVAGRAHFQVAHERRPFDASAGGAAIEDLGTGFAVSLEGAAVQVSVTEGRVLVRAAGEARTLDAGQAVALAAGRLSAAQTGLTEEATAWRRGLAVFDGTPLGEAVQAFARYHALREVAVDARVAHLRISGRFRTADLQGFLAALEDAHRVRARLDGGVVRLEPRR